MTYVADKVAKALTYSEIVAINHPTYSITSFDGETFASIVWSSSNPIPALTQVQLDAEITTHYNRQVADIADSVFLNNMADAQLAGNGVLVKHADGSFSFQQLTGTANQLVVTNGDSLAGQPTIALATNPVIPGTGDILIPVGSTAQRPTGVQGMHRFNSTLLDNETYNNGEWTPYGKVLQTVTGVVPVSTTTLTVPYDNTIPLVTEGFQIWTTTFTPKSVRSKLIINFVLTLDQNTNTRTIVISCFAGSTNIASVAIDLATAGRPNTITYHAVCAPASLSPIVIQARLGANGSGTTFINQGSAVNLGGAMASQYTIMEILP